MADTYEKLAELCDSAEWLMCKMHGVLKKFGTEARPDILFDTKEIKQARTMICKNYAKVMDPSEIERKLPLFKSRARKIVDELSKDYSLFVKMMKFREDTLSLLRETIRNSVNFKFGCNTDLTEKLLDLVTSYVRLHLMLDPANFVSSADKPSEKILGPQDIVILYQTALCVTNSGRDHDSNELKGYLQKFCEDRNALRTIKDDMQPISEMVGVYLLRFHKILDQLMDSKTSTQKIVRSAAFSTLDKIEKLGQPIDTLESYQIDETGGTEDGGASGGAKILKNYYGSAQFYFDMSFIGRIRTWVFFGLLACPAVLSGPDGAKAINLLKLVASDGWRIRVFRDKILDMHETWDEHFKFLKEMAKAQKNSMSYHGSRKEHLTEIEKDAMMRAAKFHAIRRAFLRNVIPPFIKLFEQCPGLLGPQFPVVLAMLGMTRDELEFYYVHRNQVPRSQGKFYKSVFGSYPKHEPEDWVDGKIVVLIGLAEKLRHFCQKNSSIVAEYHALFLSDVRAKQAEDNRECLSRLTRCQDDFNLCLKLMKQANSQSDLMELRKAWQRCASLINDGWNPPRKYKAQVHLLQTLMDIAVRQSRYVDMQAFVHSKFTSLKALWWHTSDVIEDFDCTTLNNDNRKNVHPNYACDGVTLFNSAVENSHPRDIDDRKEIGQNSVRCARWLLSQICKRIAKAVRVNYHMRHELELTNKSLHTAEESDFNFRVNERHKMIYQNTDALHYMCRLAQGLSQHPTIVVYNTEFTPRLYLREVLCDALKRHILGDKVTPSLVSEYRSEPGKIFDALGDFLKIFGQACDLAGVDKTSLIREVLREQVGSTGASIDARSSVMLYDGATIVSQLSDVFVKYIQDVVESSFIEDTSQMATYCPIYNGFIKLGIRGKRDKKQLWLQSKFNSRELANLMGLLGPTGVRFVQANLLEKVFKPKMKRLLEIVHKNRDKIQVLNAQVELNVPEALDVALHMDFMHDFMNCLGTISVLLAFRGMLYSALALAGTKTPIIQQFCDLATRGVAFEDSSETMDLVSQAAGMTPVADYLMQEELLTVRQGVIKTVQGQSKMLESNLGLNIAILAAAAFTNSAFWHPKVKYVTSLGVFNNNAHLFGPTLMKLVYDITSLESTIRSSDSMQTHSVKLHSANILERYYRIASNLLLRLKAKQNSKNVGKMPLQIMIYAMQMSAKSTEQLVKQNVLENILPYKYVHFCWSEIVRGRRGQDPSYFKTKNPEELLHVAKIL